jgi:hypothetical protein
MNKAAFHGEVSIIKKEISVPKSAKKLTAKNGFYIIADSESTGNHHIVLEKDGVDIYELNGVLYLNNETDATVECVIKERHDSITLEPGTWEIKRAQEFDYYTLQKRSVAD